MLARTAILFGIISVAAATCDLTCSHATGHIVVSHVTTTTALTHKCWVDHTTDTCMCTCPDEPACPTPALISSSTTYPVYAGSSDNYYNYCNYMVTADCGDMCADPATRGRCSDECDEHKHNMPPLQCPASYTLLPHATTTITDRTVGATASAACDSQVRFPGRRFLSPTLNIAKVEAALGGSAKTHKDSHAGKGLSERCIKNANCEWPIVNGQSTGLDYPLCGANQQFGQNIAKNQPTSKSHTDNLHMAERFCLYHGYTAATDIEVKAEDGACAIYHKEGNGNRIDKEHGLKLHSITCVNNLGHHAFANPTITIATAEATLGGSGDVAAYAAAKPKHVSPDDTVPYALCAGTHADGSEEDINGVSYGPGGHNNVDRTNNHHMAQRFCELEGYTGVDTFQIGEIKSLSLEKAAQKGVEGANGGCAIYHDDGTGRRWDNEADYAITEIICTKPVASADPVITCQADGTWEPDRSCRCSSADGTFTDPTVDLAALELALGGSGDPLAVEAKHQAPLALGGSAAPMLLCGEEGVNGNPVLVDGGVSKSGSGHTNDAHMADRFCEYHGYPGGHVSVETVSDAGGECAVYHNDGTGRRYDSDHVVKISRIVCVDQCADHSAPY